MNEYRYEYFIKRMPSYRLGVSGDTIWQTTLEIFFDIADSIYFVRMDHYDGIYLFWIKDKTDMIRKLTAEIPEDTLNYESITPQGYVVDDLADHFEGLTKEQYHQILRTDALINITYLYSNCKDNIMRRTYRVIFKAPSGQTSITFSVNGDTVDTDDSATQIKNKFTASVDTLMDRLDYTSANCTHLIYTLTELIRAGLNDIEREERVKSIQRDMCNAIISKYNDIVATIQIRDNPTAVRFKLEI